MVKISNRCRKLCAFLIIIFFLTASCVKAQQQNNAAGSNSSAKKTYIKGSIKITKEELLQTLIDLPAANREKIAAESETFLRYMAELVKYQQNDKNYIFYPVDKVNFLPENFTPSDLTPLDGKGVAVNKKDMKLRYITLAAFKEMDAQAKTQGIKLVISSSFRTYEYQKNLYNYYIKIYGQEETDKISAPPGSSQHQLGTVIDFNSIELNFKDSDAGKWIKENGWKYGFSLSFPENFEEITGYSFEPWHYRYITKTGALAEKEFFSSLQYLFLDYFSKHWEFFAKNLAAE